MASSTRGFSRSKSGDPFVKVYCTIIIRVKYLNETLHIWQLDVLITESLQNFNFADLTVFIQIEQSERLLKAEGLVLAE